MGSLQGPTMAQSGVSLALQKKVVGPLLESRAGQMTRVPASKTTDQRVADYTRLYRSITSEPVSDLFSLTLRHDNVLGKYPTNAFKCVGLRGH